MKNETMLFADNEYLGIQEFSKIEEFFRKYSSEAIEKTETLPPGWVVLYAVCSYDDLTGAMLSADFMMLELPCDRYTSLCSNISKNCRLFFFSSH